MARHTCEGIGEPRALEHLSEVSEFLLLDRVTVTPRHVGISRRHGCVGEDATLRPAREAALGLHKYLSISICLSGIGKCI